MKIKITSKLFTSIILMVVSFTLMVSVTFAWFTLSDNPSLTNVKITIGGDSSIQIAPDIQVSTDERMYSYPGKFTKYATLQAPEGAVMSPVSTADGVNWFIPKVDNQKGEMLITTLQDSFYHDDELYYANSEEGGYIYIDFWLVSPLEECFIRLCTGPTETNKTEEDEIGSYVIQLPESVKDFTNETGYRLDDSYETLSASCRVGFLVNDDVIQTEDEMLNYAKSDAYEPSYKSLKGVYESNSEYDFLIYEPNGLSHPNEGHSVQLGENGIESIVCEEGEYWITRPIALAEDNTFTFADIQEQLIIQTKNSWLKNINTDTIVLDELYQVYLKTIKNPTLDGFYESVNSYINYVNNGYLFTDSWDLYLQSLDNKVVTKEQIETYTQGGLNLNNVVQTSQIVKLEKNVPQKVRMFVWIEGQDVDCNYNAADQTISLRLELAGSSGA